jgi:hypothetical protein
MRLVQDLNLDKKQPIFSSNEIIICPLCDRANEITKEMKLLNCNSCGALIHLGVMRHHIQWH